MFKGNNPPLAILFFKAIIIPLLGAGLESLPCWHYVGGWGRGDVLCDVKEEGTIEQFKMMVY